MNTPPSGEQNLALSCRPPAAAPADAVTAAAPVSTAAGVCFSDLEPLTELVVRTQNTRYRMTVLNPTDGEVIIQGGRRFEEPVRCIFHGCSFGAGRFLTPGCIVPGMHMEVVAGGKRVITSRVCEIGQVDATRDLDAF